MRQLLLVVAALLAADTAGISAQSQPDPLGACMADNTTGRDRKELATWIFLAMAAHPDIKALAPSDLEAATTQSAKTLGALVTRLLSDSCVEEAKAATKTGTSSAFMVAFRRLGEVAMQELMADPAVAASVGQFERFLDQDRLKKAFGPG